LYGILCIEYPDLKQWVLGFCSEEDIPKWRSEGWRFLEVAFLNQKGMDTFNQAVNELKYGLTNSMGHVKWKSNFLMIQERDRRTEQINLRNERSERQYSGIMEGQGYVAPGDARGTTESSYEEEHFTAKEDGTPPKRRGRPPGSKNKKKG
jgi:hypothetical protein